jgi:hypothetical protein
MCLFMHMRECQGPDQHEDMNGEGSTCYLTAF